MSYEITRLNSHVLVQSLGSIHHVSIGALKPQTPTVVLTHIPKFRAFDVDLKGIVFASGKYYKRGKNNGVAFLAWWIIVHWAQILEARLRSFLLLIFLSRNSSWKSPSSTHWLWMQSFLAKHWPNTSWLTITIYIYLYVASNLCCPPQAAVWKFDA